MRSNYSLIRSTWNDAAHWSASSTKRKERLLKLYLDGVYEKEWLDKELAALDKEHEELEAKLRDLEARIKAVNVIKHKWSTLPSFVRLFVKV